MSEKRWKLKLRIPEHDSEATYLGLTIKWVLLYIWSIEESGFLQTFELRDSDDKLVMSMDESGEISTYNYRIFPFLEELFSKKPDFDGSFWNPEMHQKAWKFDRLLEIQKKWSIPHMIEGGVSLLGNDERKMFYDEGINMELLDIFENDEEE